MAPKSNNGLYSQKVSLILLVISSLVHKKYTQVSAEVKNETAICKKGDSIKLSAKEKKFFYIHTLLDNLSFYIQFALPADGIGNRYCLQALFFRRDISLLLRNMMSLNRKKDIVFKVEMDITLYHKKERFCI